VFIFLLYPIGLAVAAVLLLVAILGRNKRHLRRATTILFLLHVAIFVLAFIAVCLDPYWDDNGSREYLPFEERWFSAILIASLVELPAGPILFLGYSYLKRDPEEDPLPPLPPADGIG